MSEHIVGLAIVPGLSAHPRLAYSDHEAIASAVREAIIQAGLGRSSPEVPLADIIQPGMTVLVKPNWVLHCNKGGHGMECMTTQPEFILAVLREMVAVKPGRVILGDAPIQGCQWDQLVSPGFRAAAELICQDCTVDFVDFRRTILREGNLVHGVQTEARGEGHYVLFDLGADSLLEPVSEPTGRFRVTMYDPRYLAATHRPGQHQYLICREALESDVILNLPKLKTHSKAGLTGALKNLVGLNGNKDYLPHHRVGGTAWGGDCYPGWAPLKRLAEYFLDIANRHIGSPANSAWTARANHILSWHSRWGDPRIEGGWYGNDTVWRMVLDLNRILLYGKIDGTMSEVPQRRIWSLTDAIVCGEGEGPLAPEPCLLGAVTFSNSSPAVDAVHAALLRLDAQSIPLIREAFKQFRWPLAPAEPEIELRHKNKKMTFLEVAEQLGTNARPSHGWAGHCELNMG